MTVSRLTTSVTCPHGGGEGRGVVEPTDAASLTDDADRTRLKRRTRLGARAYDSTSSACTLLFNISVDMTPT